MKNTVQVRRVLREYVLFGQDREHQNAVMTLLQATSHSPIETLGFQNDGLRFRTARILTAQEQAMLQVRPLAA